MAMNQPQISIIMGEPDTAFIAGTLHLYVWTKDNVQLTIPVQPWPEDLKEARIGAEALKAQFHLALEKVETFLTRIDQAQAARPEEALEPEAASTSVPEDLLCF